MEFLLFLVFHDQGQLGGISRPTPPTPHNNGDDVAEVGSPQVGWGTDDGPMLSSEDEDGAVGIAEVCLKIWKYFKYVLIIFVRF